MTRDIRERRAKGVTKVAPEQARYCRFYDAVDNCCGITKGGELICKYKKCSLWAGKDKGDVTCG